MEDPPVDVPVDATAFWQEYGQRVVRGDFDFSIWQRHGVPPGVIINKSRRVIIIGRPLHHFKAGKKVYFKRTFTDEERLSHAAETWDHNPFHLNPEFCAKTRFKKPIMHGLLVGAMICHFGGDIYPGPAYLATSIHFDFVNAVYPGDTVLAEGRVEEVDAKRHRVKFAMTCWKAGEKDARNIKVLEGYVVGVPMQVEVPFPEGFNPV